MIYPPRCIGCGDLMQSDFGLCGVCWRDTPFIAGTVCEACGIPVLGAPDGVRIECDDCMRRPRPWTAGRASLLYRDKARTLVLRLKHGDRCEIARPAGLWLARAARPLLTEKTLIAPIPLHWTRLMRRRYNQSALMAQELGRVVERPVCPDLLHRRHRTPSLDGKTETERFDILSQAIHILPNRMSQVCDRDVLLVDDVMTSGATFSAAALACRAAGARAVFVLALARVAKDA